MSDFRELENMEAEKNSTSVFKWVIAALFCVTILAILVLLYVDMSGGKRKHQSDRYKYQMTYNADRYAYGEVLMDSQNGIYMERFYKADAELNSYISVVRIDASVNLDEVLQAFASDTTDSYNFDYKKDESTFGAGDYKATHIYYHDTNASKEIDVHYYYVADKKVLVTAAFDKEHEKEILKMLKTFKFVE